MKAPAGMATELHSITTAPLVSDFLKRVFVNTRGIANAEFRPLDEFLKVKEWPLIRYLHYYALALRDNERTEKENRAASNGKPSNVAVHADWAEAAQRIALFSVIASRICPGLLGNFGAKNNLRNFGLGQVSNPRITRPRALAVC